MLSNFHCEMSPAQSGRCSPRYGWSPWMRAGWELACKHLWVSESATHTDALNSGYIALWNPACNARTPVLLPFKSSWGAKALPRSRAKRLPKWNLARASSDFTKGPSKRKNNTTRQQQLAKTAAQVYLLGLRSMNMCLWYAQVRSSEHWHQFTCLRKAA